MKILITGGNGFVGKYLSKILHEEFPKFNIYSNPFDITDQELVYDIVNKINPDICFHLAAVSSVRIAEENPENAWNVNLHGTLNLARILYKKNKKVIFIFASSAEIYGKSFCQRTALDEMTLLEPMSTYACTKSAADLALGAMALNGLHVIRLRLFNHTGMGQNPNFVVPSFIDQIVRIEAGLQKPVLSVGNLNAERDFLDVIDVCEVYKKLIIHSSQIDSGTILNICSGYTRSILSIVYDIINISNVKVDIFVDPRKYRSLDIPYESGTAQRAMRILEWKPRITWDKTIKNMLMHSRINYKIYNENKVYKSYI